MSAIDLLHPALRHHIVNSFGWKDVRSFQAAVMPEILAGKHALVLAPTAGGKTEAAFFPILSRMLTEDWRGLSVLYICPIRALLNNLETRLARYCNLVGRNAAVWHGDISATHKNRMIKEPPDCLLTTPESLEAMLISSRMDARRIFGCLRVVVVDEIHAFAGDDRGWHLLAVLERLTVLCENEPQRVGLSATVGNPEELMTWLAGHCKGGRTVYCPPADQVKHADVTIDYVGHLENAATVIARLHRGEKRLVFVDSRSRAEKLATLLREREVNVTVTHSSLAAEERKASEEAFATGTNCVIVATSALELGMDIGDLDRVIQLDAPQTISSFLQRMGRTGRRSNTHRNCLFLATTDEGLIQATALVHLWVSGFIENVMPPPKPYRIVAQQMIALLIQEKGLRRNEWNTWIGRIPAFHEDTEDVYMHLASYMLERKILDESDGIFWLGSEGERIFGKKNYLDLLSVFTSPPLITVFHGRQELGYVDRLTFKRKSDGPVTLSLSGRHWKVNYVDWQRRSAYVEPSENRGRSLWSGAGRTIGQEVARAMAAVLTGSSVPEFLSKRARERLAHIREGCAYLSADSTTISHDALNHWEWWTFEGTRTNLALQAALDMLGCQSQATGVAIRFTGPRTWQELRSKLAEIDWSNLRVNPAWLELGREKFDECVPSHLNAESFRSRFLDRENAYRVAMGLVNLYRR